MPFQVTKMLRIWDEQVKMYCDETYLYSMLTFQASRSYSLKCGSVYIYIKSMLLLRVFLVLHKYSKIVTR